MSHHHKHPRLAVLPTRWALGLLALVAASSPATTSAQALPRAFQDRHARVEREIERTQELWEEVNGRVAQTGAASLRELVELASRVQARAQAALRDSEGAFGPTEDQRRRAEHHLRTSLTLTLQARDMTTRAARQLREELSQEENARRTLERVQARFEHLRSEGADRRSGNWDQARALLEQARLQFRDGNFEQALRLGQNAANVLDTLASRSGGGADLDQVRAELERGQERLRRARERGDRDDRPLLQQVERQLRDAEVALGEGRVRAAAELVRSANRLLGQVEGRAGEASDQRIAGAIERLDGQIARFAERLGDEAPPAALRLFQQAEQARDRARRALEEGQEERARQQVRAAADLLARIQKLVGRRG